jgi:hypothetical protein
MRRTSYALVALTLLVSGCGADDPKLLRHEVDGLIRPGMSMAAAEKALGTADFSCGPDVRGRDCSRSRSNAVIVTCVQRVTLIPDAKGETLAAYDMPARVACIGTP